MRNPRHHFLRQMILHVIPVVAAALSTPFPGRAQNFAQPQVVPTQSWPSNILAGDFDGDGNQDLLYLRHAPNTSAGQPDTLVEIVYGDGKGNFGRPFSQGSLYSVGGLQLVSYDVNGDGISDVVIAQGAIPPAPQVTLTVWFGSPQRTLQPASVPSKWIQNGANQVDHIAMQATFYGYSPALMVFDTGNYGTVYSVDSAGNFRPRIGGALTRSGPFFWQDVNGDGNADLVVLDQGAHAVDVYLSTGYAPPYYPPTRYTGVSGAYSVLLKDVDRDSHPDLVIEGANGRIDVFHGNPDGTFATTSEGGSGLLDGTTGNGGHLITVADLNHDGQLDAITSTPSGISTLLGNGTQYLGLKGIYNAGPGRSSYALADFNSDGNLDLAVDSPDGVAILFGKPDGSFQTGLAYPTGLPAMSSVVGAFTSSGKLDAVVSTTANQAQFLKGNGDGTFTYAGSPGAATPTTIQTGLAGLWSGIAAADFNGDGLLDLAITTDGPNALLPTNGSGITVQLGNGDGTFKSPVNPYVAPQFSFPAASSCSPPFNHFPGLVYGTSAIADFTGDGLPDIANRGDDGYRILRGNNGSASNNSSMYPTLFSAYVDGGATTVDCNAHAHNLVVAGDLDGDGRADLVFQGSQGSSGSLLEFLSDPTGKPVQMGDLAVDGSLTTPGQLTAPALNVAFNGAAIPTALGGLGFPAFPGSAVIADLDRDGNNDLIVTYANLAADRTAPTSAAPNRIYLWFGSGGGKFLTSAKHPVNPVVLTPSRNFYQAVVADVDGDKIPDLILSDGYILSVQIGKGDGTFGAETHYLAGQGINGISVADVDGDGTMDLVVANGGAVLANPVANLDSLATNPDVNTGGVTVLLNHAAVTLPTIAATVTANPEPSTYGSAFTISAIVSPSTTNPNPVTGSFAFAVDGIAISSATISGTSAMFVTPSFVYATLTPGVHTLTADYSGDANWAPSTITGTHKVSLNPTQLSLILCVDPPNSNFPCGTPINTTPLIPQITMYYGQSVDGVAIESALNLTGTITFSSGSSIFCVLNANLQQGSQTCPPNSGIFPAGTTTVTAMYSGDSLNAAYTSNGVVVIVVPDPTTATLRSSVNPSTFGQPVTFTANVQGNFAVGAGPVLFLDGATTLGPATLDASGHATFTTSTLAVGTHLIRVAFPGSANFASTTSAILNQIVQAVNVPVQSVIALASSVNPSAPGQAVTFTASVSVLGSATTTPSGTVTFLDGPATVGTGTINPATGIAIFTTSLLTTGSHPITANYAGLTGTPTILPSTSAILTQVVAAAIGTGGQGFTLNVTPTPVKVGAGATAILLVKVQATPGFGQTVALTCTGLPPESACTFVQPTIPVGGGSTTLQFAVSAPHSCGTTTPYFIGSASTPPTSGTVAAMAVPALFAGGFIFAGIRRRRKGPWLALTVLATGLCGLAMLSGCGNCTDLGTKPGSYSFTVVATAQGGPNNEVHSQTIPVTVTIP